jgi:YVTN family beta-propeller protein
MHKRSPGRPPTEGLTPAETRVLAHVREGQTNAEIATRLGVSVNTVRYHVSNLLAKAGLGRRRQLADWQPPAPRAPRKSFWPLAGLGAALTVSAAAVAIVVTILVERAATGPGDAAADVQFSLVGFPPPAVVPAPDVRSYAAPAGGVPTPLFLVTWAEGTTPPGGLLRPVDPTTGEDIPGFEPIDIAQAVSGLVSPSGEKLFAANALSGSAGGWAMQSLDLAMWSGTDLPANPRGAVTAWLPGERELVQVTVTGARQSEVSLVSVGTAASRPVATIDAIAQGSLAISPGGEMVYFVAFESEDGYVTDQPAFIIAVSLRDGSTKRIAVPGLIAGQVHEAFTGGEAYFGYHPAIALLPGGEILYVAHAESDAITAIDTASGSVAATTSVARRPSRFERFGSWVADMFADEAEAKGGPYRTRALTVTPDGSRLLVAGTVSEPCAEYPCMEGAPAGLRVINADTLAELARFEGIGNVAFTPDGRYAVGTGAWQGPPVVDDWLTLYGSGLTIVDLERLAVVAEVNPGARYLQVVIPPDGTHALALTNEPGEAAARESGEWCRASCFRLDVIDISSGTVVAQRAIAGAWAQIIGPQ